MKIKLSLTSRIRTMVFLISVFLAVSASWAFDGQLSPIMRRNYQLLLDLQRYTASPERFSDARNRPRVQALVGELRKNAHALPQRLNQTNPGQAAIATLFGDYLGDIQRSLSSGNYGYARNKIRTATGFCMECHTSLTATPSFMDLEKGVTASMTPFDKAEFFAATRQFDEALVEYRHVFSSQPQTEEAKMSLARAVRGALSISVRVQQNPSQTLEILEQASKIKGLPYFLTDNLNRWKRDAKAWASENPFNAKIASQWLAQSQKLFNRVEAGQAYPADHSMDISLFRAVGYAQEALSKNPTANEKAKAFYLLGSANSILADPLLWELDEIYFESCIREVPHTDTARQCFDRFAQEMYFEYAGSAGMDLPPEDLARLARLREMAQ